MKRFLKFPFFTLLVLMAFSCEPEEESKDTSDPDGAWEVISEYSLNYSYSIGSPIANPIGIATDQENIWLICGAQHDSTYTLLYYDPNTFLTIKEIVVDSLLEQQGDFVGGLTYYNDHLWVAISGQTNKVVKIDTANGYIIKTWSGPQTGGPTDLTYSETRNLFFMSSGNRYVYDIHTLSGGSNYFFSHPVDSRNNGIAVRGDEFWVGDLFFNYVYIFDIHTGEYLGCIPNALQRRGNMCFHNGQLAVVDESGVRFYDVVP